MGRLALIFSVLLLISCNAGPSEKLGMSKWQNPPAMKMGTYGEIAIATKNLSESQAFYQRLGFEIIPRKAELRPHILLTDGVIQIHLYENTFESPALLYRSLAPTHRLAHYKTIGLKYRERTQFGGRGRVVTFPDPGGFHVGIIDGPEEPQIASLGGVSKSKLGQFEGLLIPARKLDESLEFWDSVGFTRESVQAGLERRATLTDGLMRIVLRQTEQAERASLSFAVHDLPQRVAELKSLGLSVREDFSSAAGPTESVMLEAPEGTRLLLTIAVKPATTSRN